MPNIKLYNRERFRIEPQNFNGDNWIDIEGFGAIIMAETYELPKTRIIIKRKEKIVKMFVYENDAWVDEYDMNDWWSDAKIIYDNRTVNNIYEDKQ